MEGLILEHLYALARQTIETLEERNPSNVHITPHAPGEVLGGIRPLLSHARGDACPHGIPLRMRFEQKRGWALTLITLTTPRDGSA